LNTSTSKKMPVECYSRVVGYFRPKADTNPGKRAEIDDRKLFDANAYCKKEFSEVVNV